MFLPRIQAPTLANDCAAISLSTPRVPPPWPVIFLKTSVRKNQLWSSVPRTPSGLWRSCRGPAPNPSIEMENAATRTFMFQSLHVSGVPSPVPSGEVFNREVFNLRDSEVGKLDSRTKPANHASRQRPPVTNLAASNIEEPRERAEHLSD